MSTTRAARIAVRSLFAGLIDDAAVFPPGSASVAEAVARHRVHRRSAYEDLVGPLLLPADQLETAAVFVEAGERLGVVVVGRPGTDPAVIDDGVRQANDNPRLELRGVELAWTPTWRDRDIATPLLVLELPRGDAQSAALRDIADASRRGRVIAKFRTGATPTWAWPDEGELALVLHTAVSEDLPLKLTGGLHHAVRCGGEHADSPQHGILNILGALHSAVVGEGVDDMAALLSQRDACALADLAAALDESAAARIRATLTAYGCCEVTDPITELTGLGLVETCR